MEKGRMMGTTMECPWCHGPSGQNTAEEHSVGTSNLQQLLPMPHTPLHLLLL